MATRSTITVCDPNHSRLRYLRVYCHWDGATLGPILKEHFNTLETAMDLVKLGELSAVNPDGSVIAYHRDRREAYNPPMELFSTSSLSFNGTQEYNYLFQDGKWFVAKGSNTYHTPC